MLKRGFRGCYQQGHGVMAAVPTLYGSWSRSQLINTNTATKLLNNHTNARTLNYLTAAYSATPVRSISSIREALPWLNIK